MNNISEKITKYVHVNPQIFSFTMLGLSTIMLVYFVAHNDEDNEQSENVSKESVAESNTVSESKEEEVSPQQGGSKRRKNKSKKTKRQKR